MGCAPESGEEKGVVSLGEDGGRVGTCSSLTNADNAQSLVDEDGVVGNVVATPIGAAVLDLLAHANGRGPELLHIGMPGGGQRVFNLSMSVLGGGGGGGERTGGRRKYHTSCRCCIGCNVCMWRGRCSDQKK